MKKFNLKIICPTMIVFDKDVKQITFRTTSEVRGILADHVPFMGDLRSHLMKITIEDGKDEYYSIKDGYLKFVNNNCSIVTNEAYNIKDVSLSSIQKEQEFWQQEQKDSERNDAKSKEAELQLKRLNQIRDQINR